MAATFNFWEEKINVFFFLPVFLVIYKEYFFQKKMDGKSIISLSKKIVF